MGPNALDSDWVLGEVESSQRRGRSQVVIDDPVQTFEAAPAGHRLKELLGKHKWLERSPDDSNLNDIILDLSAGFSQYRRETRTYLVLAGIAVAILCAALVSVWLGYERSAAREQAKTQQLLAVTGRLTTQVEAALGAQPPRREDALRLALKATRDTIATGLPVPNSTEQALRNAIAGSGGRPVSCGLANPSLTEAPRQLGPAGPLVAAAGNGTLCAWNAGDLSFVRSFEKPKAIARRLETSGGRIWEVDRLGHLFLLDGTRWSDGYQLVGTLSGFVEAPGADALVNDPETVITPSSVIQHDFAGNAVRIWTLPDRPAVAVSPFVLSVASARFDARFAFEHG